MGRPKSKQEIAAIQTLFSQYKEQIVRDGKVVSKKSEIWTQIASALGNNVTTLSLYTAACKNYFNSSEILQLSKHNSDFKYISDSEESTEEESHDKSNEEDTFSFKFVLSYPEYLRLNPHQAVYNRNDECKTSRQSRRRTYYVFGKRVWTHLLHDKIDPIMKKNGFKCVFMYKRGKIFPASSKTFASFHGKCKECATTLIGEMHTEPSSEKDSVITFTLKGNWPQRHRLDTKRPLSGLKREAVSKYLVETNIAPSQYRIRQACQSMEFGESEPPALPATQTLRMAKHELVKRQRRDEDPILAVCKLKVDPKMKGAIHDIGIDPFFVHYWTNLQIHVYKRYCQRGYSRLSIDATGKVVKAVTKVSGEKSKHIFLYECTVGDSATSSQYSVLNMLSESHNALAIYAWLANWVRSGAVNFPNEVVTDMSLALIYAVVMAFTVFKTLQDYLLHCYNALFLGKEFQPGCYVRNDVAHTMKLIADWPSLKNQHRLTRRFYLKTMGQLIQCKYIEDAETIIEALFTVALSDTEGVNNDGDKTSCEVRKEWLKRRIATGSLETLTGSQELDEINEQVQFEEYNIDMLNPFQTWANRIFTACQQLVNQTNEIGDRGNQQCLPYFVDDFLKLVKTIPLWTAIMCSKVSSAPTIASSAHVESSFNNLKHRIFRNSELPLRVDDFLEQHISSTDGAIKIIEAREKMNTDETSLIDDTRNRHEFSDNSQTSTSNAMLKPPKDSQLNAIGSSEKTIQSSEFLNITQDQIIFCPTCQLGIGNSKVICEICNAEVHGNDICSAVVEDSLICMACSRHSTVIEQLAVENWRGLGKSVKKRPRASYLEPMAELLHNSYDLFLNKVSPIGILRNGHSPELLPVKFKDGYSVALSNTCGFDSIVQLLATAYSDSLGFKNFLDVNRTDIDVAALIENIVKYGVSKKSYRIRAEILRKESKAEEHPQSLLYINLGDNICNILLKLHLPCAMRALRCEKCKYMRTEMLLYCEMEIIDGQLNFQHNLEESFRQKVFRRNCGKNNCDGSIYGEIVPSLTHLFIEPIDLRQKNTEFKTQLRDIPYYIILSSTTYILRGVIAYTGPSDGSSLGHFTCMSFRHNNKWELYDDRMTKCQPCSAASEVRVQLILYSL